MESVINIFKNDMGKSRGIIQNSLDLLGPTPGFGWNNLAMARAHYYSGDLEACKKSRDKADNFKELHVNSTWGKLQYDTNSLLFQYLYHKKKIEEIKFTDSYYWLNAYTLMQMAGHYFKMENAHLLLASDLSANPERFLVMYNIFSSENTIFFDEMWEVIRSFNPQYFIRLFSDKRDSDARPAVIKYYNYFIARFLLEDGKPQQAIGLLQNILSDPTVDPVYEKLLIARVCEGLTLGYEEMDMEDGMDTFLLGFYTAFPQLVPFSGLKMKFRLYVPDEKPTEGRNEIISDLRDCNIEFVEDTFENEVWPAVSIEFKEIDSETQIQYAITISGQDTIEGTINIDDYQNPGQILAYRLFNISLEEG